MTQQFLMTSVVCAASLLSFLSLPNCAVAQKGVPGLNPIGVPLEHQGIVKFAKLSPDGKIVLTLDEYGVCWLWDVAAQTIIGGSIQGPHRTTGLNFDRKGKTIVGSGSPYSIVRAAGFTADGKSLIAISSHLQHWTPATALPRGKPIPYEGINAHEHVISPTGKEIFIMTRTWGKAGGKRFGVAKGRFLNATTGAPVGPVMDLGESYPTQDVDVTPAFSPDGQMLIVVFQENIAQRWDVATGKRIRPDIKTDGLIEAVVRFSDDGKAVLTTGGLTGQVWDPKTSKPLGPRFPAGRNWGNNVSLSPNGKKVVTRGSDGLSEIRDVATGKRVVQLKGESNFKFSAFSPDGRLVLTRANNIQLFDAPTGKLLAQHQNPYNSMVTFSRESDMALAIDGKRVHLWKMPK